MNKTNRSYWFFMDPYVHISLKNNCLLLYNPLTGKLLEYSDVPAITNLVKRLQSKKNLMVVKLMDKELQELPTSRFIEDVRKNFMGDLIDTSYSKGKPIQMMPIIVVQKDVKRRKKEPRDFRGETMMQYVFEVSIYINSACDQDCGICRRNYMQTLCCTKGKMKDGELNISKIRDLTEQISPHLSGGVNILGGDIFKYSKFEKLVEILCVQPFLSVWYSHYLNININAKRLELLDFDTSFFKILVTFPYNGKELKAAMELVSQKSPKHEFVFIIQNEDELNTAQNIISSLNINTFSFQPHYNGNNRVFFSELVFINKEDILEAKPTLKDIYARGPVNPSNFGRLTVLNNGHVHANVNAPKLGILGKDSVYDMIYKEVHHGRSWRRTRKNVLPCKQCTFELMCPPLSNYEYAFGKNNLCHIWDAKPIERNE